jgi:hypothetical protein
VLAFLENIYCVLPFFRFAMGIKAGSRRPKDMRDKRLKFSYIANRTSLERPKYHKGESKWRERR